MDKLIVKGLGALLDGEYEFDFIGLLTPGDPGCLTNREAHRVKTMAGVRMGELAEALGAGDNDVLVALAAVVLTRRGKRFEEDVLWDAPVGSGVELVLADRDEAGEPEIPPADAPPQSGPTGAPETSGGDSSNLGSAHPANGQSPTGLPDSARSAISDQPTLVT